MTHDALKPVDFHILLALADGPLHGYGLVRRMERESEGRVRLLPGNLYAMLRRLDEGGWVEESEAPTDASDSRRRYYRLTSLGQEILDAETARLERLLGAIRGRDWAGRELSP